MVKGDLQTELDDFFNLFSESQISKREITDSAFTQARQKFSHQAFIELNQILCKTFYRNTEGRLWHGFKLKAVDGSTSKLPGNDKQQRLLHHFGKSCEQMRAPCAKISEFYDVLNGITLDVQCTPINECGERELALRHFKNVDVGQGDLVLFDRGYNGFRLFSYLKGKDAHLCCRMPCNGLNSIPAFVESEEKETQVTFDCSPDVRRQIQSLGEDISTKALAVRLLRIELPSGEVEVLLTTLLDTVAYPHEWFKALYHQRWAIEEDYKTLKSRLELGNYTGLTVEAVLQDINAKVLSKNMVSIAVYESHPIVERKTKARKHQYKLNFSKALSKFKNNIVLLLHNISDLTDLLSQLIVEIGKNLIPIRPDRQFERDQHRLKGRRSGGFSMNKKRCK